MPVCRPRAVHAARAVTTHQDQPHSRYERSLSQAVGDRYRH